MWGCYGEPFATMLRYTPHGRHQGGPGACSPGKILKLDALRCILVQVLCNHSGVWLDYDLMLTPHPQGSTVYQLSQQLAQQFCRQKCVKIYSQEKKWGCYSTPSTPGSYAMTSVHIQLQCMQCVVPGTQNSFLFPCSAQAMPMKESILAYGTVHLLIQQHQMICILF